MIIWKNRNFKDLGIIVEKVPKISKAKKKITIFEIPGRNGFISIDEKTYEPFSISIECHIQENANLNDICEFLDGYGTLSFNNNTQYTAIINNAISFDKVLMFKKFIVHFLVNPISEDIRSQICQVPIASESMILMINDTYYDIEPKIFLVCNGNISITINNQTFHLKDTDGTYILDCKNKLITKNDLNVSNIMQGEFPKLKKGSNHIGYIGNVENFEIEYKKTYLWGG